MIQVGSTETLGEFRYLETRDRDYGLALPLARKAAGVVLRYFENMRVK